MSASGRFKRWLASWKKKKQTEPETPLSEAPTRAIGLPEPPGGSLPSEVPLSPHRPARDVISTPVTQDVTHVHFRKTTRRLAKHHHKKDHILRKDPITRKISRVDLKDIDDMGSKVIYYDARGRLLE